MALMGDERTVRKYQQLRRLLADHVATLPSGAVLPTERDLAVRYGVSRSTVRQALGALADAGVVYRVQSAGTFVADRPVSRLALISFTEDMVRRHLRPSSRVLSVEEVLASASVAEDLHVDAGTAVFSIVRLREADGVPMCIETVYLPADKFPGLTARDLTGSLYEVLGQDYAVRLVRAEQVVRATVADEASAALLGIAPGSPQLTVKRVAFDERERPLERAVSVYRADRYDIRCLVQREVS
jgi:GntR family transcriptional regulator